MKHHGLTSSKAEELLVQYGHNHLPRQKRVSTAKVFFRQFTSPLVFVLFFASLTTFFLKDYTDTIVILLAMGLNTVLGFYQELKAEHSLYALQQMLSIKCEVLRDNTRQTVLSELLVPGDVVYLSAGDQVPADGELLESHHLTINEAVLTGESMPVAKNVSSTEHSKSRVYMGTTVSTGIGVFRVVKTGSNTQMGKIAGEITAIEEEPTPLQKRVGRLAFQLTILVAIFSALVGVVGIFTGNSLQEMFEVSVALAVSMIPEGMLVSLTVILALGMQRILHKNALVRRLIAAETLGTVTLIATDKTGTLTEGSMKVKNTKFINKKEALRACIFANDLTDPIETAIWNYALKMGIDGKKLSENNKREIIKPFSSEHMYMTVAIGDTHYTKGAPEVVLGQCRLSKKEKQQWLQNIDDWSKQGLRLLGLSRDEEWLGLIGVEDPIRDNVKEVFARAHRAGIRVVMVTGDYVGTAEAVWKRIKGTTPTVIEAEEMRHMDKEEFLQLVPSIDIFARVSPKDKLRIVEAFKKHGEVIALLGDGVNDAPALKAADIGIVVGSASDVARETADMVLIDSNFKTIVDAVEEGRGIFETIKKVILYLLSNSFAEVSLLLLCMISGLPLALSAAQILWINLVTDGLPNLAFTMEPYSKGLLKRKPISADSPIVDNFGKMMIIIISLSIGLIGFGLFAYFLEFYGLSIARSVAFTTVGLSTLMTAFLLRSIKDPFWRLNHFENPLLIFAALSGVLLQLLAIYHPVLNKFLHTVPLGKSEWFVIIVGVFFTLLLIEALKLFLYSVLSKDNFSKLSAR